MTCPSVCFSWLNSLAITLGASSPHRLVPRPRWASWQVWVHRLASQYNMEGHLQVPGQLAQGSQKPEGLVGGQPCPRGDIGWLSGEFAAETP